MSSTRGSALLGAAVALAALLGCDSVVSPPRFPHEAHLTSEKCGEAGQPDCPTCNSCHGGITEAEAQAIPTGSACVDCHGEAGAGMFSAQHERNVRFLTERTITFPHGKHLAMDAFRGQCFRCHPGVSDDGKTETVFPAMPVCLECHEEQFSEGVCTPCHKSGNLATLVPKTFLRHDMTFIRRHGEEATRKAKVCSQCHAEKFCSDCHDMGQTMSVTARRPDAIERGVNHRGDFISRHAIEARTAPGRCTVCHEVSSCEGCHVQRGVSANRQRSVNPHPPGWMGTGDERHGRAARRDILTCAACHDQGPASNCINCHAHNGPGGNPHPDGWSSARGLKDGMCAFCH